MNNIITAHGCLGLLLALTVGIGGCTKQPPTTVRDEAQLFTGQQTRAIALHHAYLVKDHDIDYRVVSTRNAGDINRYAEATFADLGVGGLSRSGRGLLLVIDTGQDKVRMEIARALEGVYPDIFVAYVERDQMVPFFRVGRVADGVLATTELIVARAQQARAGREFEPDALAPETAGGGAVNSAEVGRGAIPQQAGLDVRAEASPEATLVAYMQAMREHNARPDLDLYTSDTRAVMSRWVTTPAQMENLYKPIRNAPPSPHASTKADAMRSCATCRISDCVLHGSSGGRTTVGASTSLRRSGPSASGATTRGVLLHRFPSTRLPSTTGRSIAQATRFGRAGTLRSRRLRRETL